MSASLQQPMRAGAGAPVLCHNDFFGPNILIGPNGTCLIDWEYAGMADYASDFGTFVVCAQLAEPVASVAEARVKKAAASAAKAAPAAKKAPVKKTAAKKPSKRSTKR